MTIHEAVVLTVLVCQGEAVLWYVGGRWNGRKAIERAKDDGYDEAYDEMNAAVPDPVTLVSAPVFDDLVASLDEDEPPLQVGHTIYPELAALAADDGGDHYALDGLNGVPDDHKSPQPERFAAGLGHPSPYTGPLTPAQRRRDKHKQRGPWAPGDLPDPPTDVGAWWQAELDALLVDGQSDWLTRNLEAVA